jgi:pyruvate/2-oxoglutarate dehydrogenase complex dihydrolipoamide acyltransferase (E2) component
MDRQDRIEKVPLGWRWIEDAFDVAPVAGGLVLCLADMTNARAAIRLMRDAKIPVTLAHLVVRACALVLSRHPEWHRIACNYRHITPGTVDIGLSMAGSTTYAPIVVLPAADTKALGQLVPSIIEAIDAAVEKEKVDLENMRRRMWVIPYGFIRRFILRLLSKSFWFRRRIAGTFQITMLPTTDACVPLLFYTGSILATGAVRDRVVAVDGKPVVRPTMWLTVCASHSAMDGMRGGELAEAIKEMLEGDELLREARQAAEARRMANSAEHRALAAGGEPVEHRTDVAS